MEDFTAKQGSVFKVSAWNGLRHQFAGDLFDGHQRFMSANLGRQDNVQHHVFDEHFRQPSFS